MKSSLSYQAALDRLNTYITANHMRHTPERKMVLMEICEMPQPFTADKLAERCAALRLSQGTIYNSLALFVSARILHAYNRENGRTSTEYEIIHGEKSQVQIICIKCGRMAEIHDKAIEHIIKSRKYSNFTPDHYTMHIYGECKVCRKKRVRK